MSKNISDREPLPVTPLTNKVAPSLGSNAAQPPRPLLWSGFTAVVVALVVYLVALYSGGLLISVYAGLRHWSAAYADNWLNTSITAQFFYVLLDEAITVLLLWCFIRIRKYQGVLRALGLTKPKPGDLLYVFGGVMAYFTFYIITINLAASLTHINVNQQQDVGFQTVATHRDLVLAFLSLVILPPLVEETIFRGFLFNGLRRHMRFVGAAILTSLLFAAPHLLESDSGGLLWTAGIDTCVLSLVLCFVREKTGRIWAGMGIHALKNLAAFYILFIHH